MPRRNRKCVCHCLFVSVALRLVLFRNRLRLIWVWSVLLQRLRLILLLLLLLLLLLASESLRQRNLLRLDPFHAFEGRGSIRIWNWIRISIDGGRFRRWSVPVILVSGTG